MWDEGECGSGGRGFQRAGQWEVRSAQLSLEEVMILIRIIPFKQDAFLERQLSRESVEKH